MKYRLDLAPAALIVTFAAVLVALAPAVGAAQSDRHTASPSPMASSPTTIVTAAATPSATPMFTLETTPKPTRAQSLITVIHYCLIALSLIVPVALGIWWFLTVFTTNLSPLKDDPPTQRAI